MNVAAASPQNQSMSWCVNIDTPTKPSPAGLASTKAATASLAAVAIALAIVAAQTQGNDAYASGLMYISGGVLLLGLALCTLSRQWVSLLADLCLLGIVLFDFVGDLFVDVDSLIALTRQDEWLQQTLRTCWLVGGVMYAFLSTDEGKRIGKCRPLRAVSKVALCMAVEVLADGSVLYARVGQISLPLCLNVLNASVPFVFGFVLGRWGGLSGVTTVARGPCALPPPTPPCAPPGDEGVEADSADSADDSMGVENEELFSSAEPTPVMSKDPDTSPDTVTFECLGFRSDAPPHAFWRGASRGCRSDAPPQALWGEASRAKRASRGQEVRDAEVRAMAQMEDLSAERMSAASSGKPASPRSGRSSKVNRRDEPRQGIPLRKAEEHHLHYAMKTTRTHRLSPLRTQAHHSDGSGACELGRQSCAVTPGCGVNSQSKETQIAMEEPEEITTSSMLPERLFNRLFL